MKRELTVNHLLQTNYLRDITKVVGGAQGLNKQVSWVHILEIKNVIKDCVDGNEMILTTGICFTDKEIAINFFKELIEQNISCLCIETALYYQNIDEELIALADEHGVPLVEITRISRFKDISKGLNLMLVKSELGYHANADIYESRMSEIEHKGTLEDGIRYTADYLNIEIAYLPSIGRQQFATSIKIQQESRLLPNKIAEEMSSDEIYCNGKTAMKYLTIGNRNYGTLVFKGKDRELTEFDQIILGRLTRRLKKELLNEIRRSEETLYKENGWIGEWLNGNLSPEEIAENMKAHDLYSEYKEYCVCTFKPENKILFSDFIMDMTLFFRGIFEQKDLYVIGYLKNDMAHYIVLNNDASESLVEKMLFVIDRIREVDKTLLNYKDNRFSLGQVVTKAPELDKSFKTSLEFIDRECLGSEKLIVFDELHMDRVLFHIIDTPYMNDFVEAYLGELLLPKNFELLQTLATYYDCNCSKKQTSDRLYIVRQTLYFRLHKLEEILGPDFAEGEKRYALEFACKAYFHKRKYEQTECTDDDE